MKSNVIIKLIVGYLKVYGNEELNRNKLKEYIHNLINELEINFDLTIDITN